MAKLPRKTFFTLCTGPGSPAWANNWAGFKKNDMLLVAVFRKPVSIRFVTLRIVVEEETGIFPPGTVEV